MDCCFSSPFYKFTGIQVNAQHDIYDLTENTTHIKFEIFSNIQASYEFMVMEHTEKIEGNFFFKKDQIKNVFYNVACIVLILFDVGM